MGRNAAKAYVCRRCESRYPQSYGRCPGCGGWGTLEEALLAQPTSKPRTRGSPKQVLRLSEVTSNRESRIRLPLEELNRVLGGGIVPGSVILLGGDPGIGKSTLLLQLAQSGAAGGFSVLYVSGEESPLQVKLRAERLSPVLEDVAVLTESNVDAVTATASTMNPSILIVDSIQTMKTDDLDSTPGSVAQLRECAARLVELAKQSAIAVILVGHVTKDGSLAGPKVLEHMVDVVLYLEGDELHAYRLLRTTKNRYGATHEVGVFDMQESGLVAVRDPSELFCNAAGQNVSGSVIAVTVEGSRAFLVEIQALSTRTVFGLPRRSANGIDINRLHMLTAVLGKRARVDVSGSDVYVNVVGGLRLGEPAVDLATALAIYSGHQGVELPRLAAIGEVGLAGEVRPVQQLKRRLTEAQRHGIQTALVPGRTEAASVDGIRIVPVDSLAQAVQVVSGSAFG